MSHHIRDYYILTKPGIVRGNIITAAAGFILAAGLDISLQRFGATIFGLALVIAGSCVANNIIDRNIDRRMTRTEKRLTASMNVNIGSLWFYAVALIAGGISMLLAFSTPAATLAAFIGCILYVVVYALAKRATAWSTLIGALSGAVPPVVGYLGVTGHPDVLTALIFLVLFWWQMPHFYAIAIFRRSEYRAAGLPIKSVIDGVVATQMSIRYWIVSFVAIVNLSTLFGYTSWLYSLIVTPAAIYWIWTATHTNKDAKSWARSVFGVSLIVLLSFSFAWTVEGLFS